MGEGRLSILNLMISHDQNEWWNRLEGANGLLLLRVSMFNVSMNKGDGAGLIKSNVSL